MKLLKRLTSLVLSFAAAVTMLALPTQATDVFWNGSTPLQPGKTYIINSTVKLREAVTLPQDATLKIAKGGQLLIYKSGSLTVNGLLRLEKTAVITNSGTLTVGKTGTVKNYGEIKSTISAAFNVKGSILNYADGSIRSSSKTSVYKDATITNTGSLYILNSCTLTNSGKITNTLSGYMSVQGELRITLSGTVKSAGHLFVGTLARVKVSGTLHLTSNSSYNSYGKVVTTANGTFKNESSRKKRYENTAALLEKYPDRVGLGATTYGQPLSLTINDESNARQLSYAVKTNLKYFNKTPDVYAISEFALNNQTPQLISLCGYKAALLRSHVMGYGYPKTYDSSWGKWIGKDGTEIPAVPTYDKQGRGYNCTTVDNWILSRWPVDSDLYSLEDFKEMLSNKKCTFEVAKIPFEVVKISFDIVFLTSEVVLIQHDLRLIFLIGTSLWGNIS